jgi:glycosyltransferase involved in cell wall biosynthesis
VSQFTAKQLQEQLHTIPKKIKVIHEGVVVSARMQECTNEQIGKTLDRYGLQAKKYILFVGSVQPRKNLVALIEAFSHFVSDSARDTADLKLVIAGGIGWMAEEVLQAPGKNGVQEKVVFTGRVSDSDLRELYSGAALYVQPSITEGFGLPVLEAMANSVPVISSDGGALPEVMGKAGLLVQLNNQSSNTNNQNMDIFVRDLAEAMKRVICDKKLQKKMIAMGLDRVKEFSWEKAARATLEQLAG